MKISGRETTASSPRESGCSGSEMDLIRSVWCLLDHHGIEYGFEERNMGGMHTVNLLFVDWLLEEIFVALRIGREKVCWLGDCGEDTECVVACFLLCGP